MFPSNKSFSASSKPLSSSFSEKGRPMVLGKLTTTIFCEQKLKISDRICVPVLLLHVCIYWFTFWHRLQPACKGLQETPLPLHKTTEVSSHFSTFVTEFMFLKRLEKRVRCKEHHLALRAGTQSIVFATSPLLHTGRVLGAARLCSWAQGGCKGRAVSLAGKVPGLQEHGCYEKSSSLLQCSLLCLVKVISQASSESSGYFCLGF